MSTTIDKKVVEMKFDNKNFENNVKTSMSTLDKLKEKLNFKGATKGLEEVSKASNNLSFSNIENSLSSLEKRFSTTGVIGMSVIHNLTTSLMGFGRKLTSFFTEGIVSGGIRRAMNLENAKFQLEGLLNDGNKVAAVMKNVTDAVDGTAYSLDAAANVASQLAASGMEAGDQMYSALRGAAGVAAMTNSSYEDIGRIYTQVAGQGRLMGDQLLQLSGRGMNAAATLGKYLNKTEAEVRDMVSKGKIDFATFAAAMDDAFGEHAKKANETVNGALSNVKSALARIGALFVAPIIEQKGPLVQFLNAIREKVNSIKNEITPFAKTTTDFINNIISKAAKLVESFDYHKLLPSTNFIKNNFIKTLLNSETAMSNLGKTIEGMFSVLKLAKKLLSALLAPVSKFVTGPYIPAVIEGILRITARFGEFFTELNKSVKIGKSFKIVSKIISDSLDLIGKGIVFVANGMKGISGYISKAINFISKGVDKVKKVIGAGINWIKENITMKDVFTGLTGAGIFVFLKRLAEVFGSVKKVIDKVGGIFDSFKKNVTPFKEALNSLNEAIVSFQQGIKVATLVGVAIAITLLTSAVKKMADIKPAKIAVGLIAIRIMIAELNAGFEGLAKTMKAYPTKNIVRTSLALIAMAEGVNILATALKKISQLSLTEMIKGLAGVGACILMLTKSIKTISDSNITLRTSLAILVLASACKTLANALTKFSALSWSEIARGLIAMGGALAEFVIAMNILSDIKGNGAIIGAAAMYIASKSLDEISENLKRLGSLSWKEIERGLTAMGGALLEFSAVLLILSDTSGMSTMFAGTGLLIASKSLDEISENLKRLGNLSWDEINRGISAMAAALLTFAATLDAISYFGGFTSVLSAVSILIVAKSLNDVYKSLKKLASMSWSEIGRGLTAMGGALAEMAIVVGALGKLAGFSSIFGATAILIVAKSLDDISKALENIGYLSWDEIARGLVGMRGALVNLSLAAGLLGKLAGFSGILGAATILIMSKTLEDIGKSLEKIGYMSWDEIAKGLVGMGGALTELSLAAGLLGKLAGFSGIIGAATILIITKSLEDIANALVKLGGMSWEEIGRGLTAMGGALAEMAIICGSLGWLTGLAGLAGAGTILLASKGLGDIADALAKFGAMSWDEINRGLTAMSGALGAIGVGGLLNTLSILGTLSIAAIAKPLGDLAESFKKWQELDYDTISNGLKAMDEVFSHIASGAWQNTLSGLGSLSIATIAEPLGTLADSVKKWQDVTIPEGLGENLKTLASGVSSFTLSGFGADALATCAPGLGQMAESIAKWKDVTVPSSIGADLATLAEGIYSFSFTFMGGWSLGTITKPLGDLAGSISKWKDVTLPASIGADLATLAEGIYSFSFCFMGGWSLSTIVKPLGDLAGSISKWKDVTVSDNIKDGLKALADGIKEFDLIGAVKLSSLADPINTLSKAFINFNKLKDNSDALLTFADNIKKCCDKLSGIDVNSISNVYTFTSQISKLVSAIKKIDGVNTSNVSKFIKAVNSLKNIKLDKLNVDTGSLSKSVSAIKGAMTKIQNTIKNSKSNTTKAMETAISGMPESVNRAKGKLNSAAKSLLDGFISKIKGKKGDATSAFKSLVTSGADGIKSKRGSFESAGKYLGEGLVTGINAKQTAVYNAGYALGQKAVQGEKDGQQSKSPSKATIKAGKWLGEGLVIGMNKMANNVYNSGKDIGKGAVNSISYALQMVDNILNSDLDSSPTITPVLDLSNVESGTGRLNSMFSNQSIGVLSNLNAINTGMNLRAQNATNSDVVAAVDKLRKDLDKIGGDTYNVNGVTYGDDSPISEAVSTLIRAINIERRT